MRLAELSHGPDWVAWVVAGLFAALSTLLLSGRGSSLIAGYNTASKEERRQYEPKKLCRTVGAGMAVITVLIVVMGLFEEVLPDWFAAVGVAIVGLDVLGMAAFCKLFCKRR